jgi:hypothetical protein
MVGSYSDNQTFKLLSFFHPEGKGGEEAGRILPNLPIQTSGISGQQLIVFIQRRSNVGSVPAVLALNSHYRVCAVKSLRLTLHTVGLLVISTNFILNFLGIHILNGYKKSYYRKHN